jgi:hypothetical protein
MVDMDNYKKHGLSFVKLDIVPKNDSNDVAKDLVENLFVYMAKLSTKYDNETFCDLPYTYSERRLDSVLLPALSKLCKTKVLVEIPAIRQCSNRRFKVDESSGRIDYWCIYKDYSFAIELKQSFDCFTTNSTRERKVIKPWLKMNEQLQSLGIDLKQYQEATKGVIRIGLHIITSYSDKPPCNQLIKQFNDSISDTSERFLKDLSKKYHSLRPDLILCWKIPTRIIMDIDQTFPGLWAVVKIYPAIKHKESIC